MLSRVYNFHDVTGATHKEVGVEEIVDDAVDKGLSGLVVISSGNFSEAISDEIAKRGLKLELYNLVNGIPKSKNEVRIPNGQILRTAKERIQLVRDVRGLEGALDDYTDFFPKSYTAHARLILQSRPDYVLCPIGSGKLWLSLVREVEATDSNSRVIGITPRGKNAFFFSTSGKKFDLSSVADKLTAPYTHFQHEVLSHGPRHTVAEVSEKQLKRAYKHAQMEGCDCEPSGAAGFVFYDSSFRKDVSLNLSDRVMIVSTGKGFKAEVADMKRRESGIKMKVATVTTALFLGFTALTFGYFRALQDQHDAQEIMSVLPDNKYGREVLEFVALREGVSSPFRLDSQQASDALTLYMMNSDGLSFVQGSVDPKKAELYQDFAMRCRNHGRPDFKYCEPQV
ncbi:hypothetical protein COY27_00245 [Candidatus Woesearchaeota archaeon CG_4_10_14_0_2_um_filter_33_13]|nr:MAG: hypothetical protein COY27_00245 [Candidatus Woesearchaeota archaeon CG_4_10_14_0_2_um_filter_33_13]